jgi:hypothetical protein
MKMNKQTTGSKAPDRQGLSRRDFLTQTALIGAGLAVGSMSRAASADPKELTT